MRSILKITLIAIILVFVTLSAREEGSKQINLSDYKVQRSHHYRYALKIYQLEEPFKEEEKQMGVLFKGVFSTFVLKDKSGKEFLYESESFSIRSPSLHQFAQINSELIELEITYRIKLLPEFAAKPSYNQVIVSFLFMISEYLPEKDLSSMHEFIKSIKDQRNIDLRQIIRQEITGPVFVYPVKNEEFSTLRIIRKELRLIGRKEVEKLVTIAGLDKKGEHANIIKPERIYEFKEFTWVENQGDL